MSSVTRSSDSARINLPSFIRPWGYPDDCLFCFPVYTWVLLSQKCTIRCGCLRVALRWIPKGREPMKNVNPRQLNTNPMKELIKTTRKPLMNLGCQSSIPYQCIHIMQDLSFISWCSSSALVQESFGLQLT